MPYDPSLPTYADIAGVTGRPKQDSLGSILASGAVQTYGGLRYGLPAAVERVAGTLTPQDEAEYAAGIQSTQRQAQKIAPVGARGIDAWWDGKVGLGRMIAEQGANMIPAMAGGLIGAVGGAAVGGPVGAIAGGIAGGTPQFIGANAQRALQETGGITREQAIGSITAAPVQAGLDMVSEAVGLPGFSRLLGPAGAALGQRLAGNIAVRVGKGVAAGALAEASTETAQQALERWASGNPLTGPEAMREYVQAFGTAAAVGGALGGVAAPLHKKVVNQAPGQSTNEDIAGAIDEIVRGPGAGPNGEVLALPAPVAYTDAAGRTVVGSGGDAELRAQPIQAELGTTQFGPPTPTPTQGETVQLGMPGAQQAEAPLAVPFEALPKGFEPDLFEPTTYDQITQAVKTLPDDQLQAVAKKAKSKKGSVPAPVVAAVEQEQAARAGSTGGAPAAASWENKRADLFKGVRSNQDLAKLKGASEEDFHAGIRSLLEAGDTRKGTLDIAEKLGILNEPGEPLAAPAGPVEEVAPSKLSLEAEAVLRPALTNRQAPADIKTLADAKTDDELDQRIYQALQGQPMDETARGATTDAAEQATQTVDTNWDGTRSPQTPSRALEDLAVARGIIAPMRDEKGNLLSAPGAGLLTEKGKALAAKAPVELGTIENELKIRGLEGPEAAAFTRGAQGLEMSQPEVRVDGLDGLRQGQLEQQREAQRLRTFYDQGQQFRGAPAVNPAVGADARVVETINPETGEVTPQVERSVETTLTPTQRIQQELSLKTDELLPGDTHAADRAAIKQAIGRGEITTPQQLGDHLVAAQRGLAIAPPVPERPFQPAVADAPTSRRVQAQRAARQQARSERTLGVGQKTRAQARNDTKSLLRQEIDAAHKGGDISSLQRLRLLDRLRRNDHKGVLRGLPGLKRDARGDIVDNIEWAAGPLSEEYARAQEALLVGRTARQVADKYLVRQAPNQFYKFVARRISAMMTKLEAAGMQFEFEVTPPGYMVRARGAMGVTTVIGDKTKVTVNGAHMGQAAGTDYETVAHEMFHAVTSALLHEGRKVKFDGTELGNAFDDLVKVGNFINDHLRRRQQQGGLSTLEETILSTNATHNEREIITWAMTNPDFQSYLDDIPYDSGTTIWGKLRAVFREMLGLQPKFDTALDELLRVADRLSTLDQIDVDNAMASRFNTPLVDARQGRWSVPGTEKVIKDTTAKLQAAVDDIPWRGKWDTARRALLGAVSVDHMAEVYGKIMPAITEFPKVDAERQATRHRFDQATMGWVQTLHREERAVQDKVQQLMRLTEFGINPMKRWEDQPELHELPNATELKGELDKARSAISSLSSKGKLDLYHDAVKLNEMYLYSEMAVRLHSMIAYDPELRQAMPGLQYDPTEGFRASQSLSATDGREYWRNELNKRVDATEQYVNALRGEMPQISKRDQNAANERLSPIESEIREVRARMDDATKAPYFHLGRHGDQFASFTIKNIEGVVDKTALNEVAKALEDAGLPVFISRATADPKVYMRFASADQRAQVDGIIKQLTQRGLLTVDDNATPPVIPRSGPREASGIAQSQSAKRTWLDQVTQKLRADMNAQLDGLDEAEVGKIKASYGRLLKQLEETWLETVSDTSLVKVMTRRKNRPGYNADMVQSFAQRAQMSALGVANMAAAPRYNTVFEKMRGSINQAMGVFDKNHQSVQAMSDLLNELQTRMANRGRIEQDTAGDTLRAATNAFFLGMSPGYVLGQVTQLGVMLLPELGKTHGFVRSAKAIGAATTPALKIMREVAKEARAQGLKRAGDITITPEIIARAGLTQSETDFVTRLVASGAIDIGSAARQLAQVAHAQDGSTKQWINAASAFGLYSEMATRLIAGLAAQKVHDPAKVRLSPEDYAHRVINEAMFNYASSNTARFMSKSGPLGAMTPVVMQFQQYTALLTQKLYREFHAALPWTEGDAQSKAQARKFLAGHATAVTVLAGSLGLPVANLLAGAVEQTVNGLGDDGDEPYDATASWRNFLASMFGREMGEVLSRGVPRALGFDVSQRFGEQDLIPFTSFLTDRREIKDWAEEQSFRSLGASVSMLTNVASGVAEIANGNVVAGMGKMLPVALQGPFKAAKMAATGKFVTTKGRELPVDPTAADIFWQAVGLAPETRAEYNEKAADQNARRTSLTREMTGLREAVISSALSGDSEGLREALTRAAAFDAKQPDRAILPGIEATIQRRLQAAAAARATGQPLGVRPQDLGAAQLTQY